MGPLWNVHISLLYLHIGIVVKNVYLLKKFLFYMELSSYLLKLCKYVIFIICHDFYVMEVVGSQVSSFLYGVNLTCYTPVFLYYKCHLINVSSNI